MAYCNHWLVVQVGPVNIDLYSANLGVGLAVAVPF